ncbi:hypothetical protein NM688_g2097 [Phlebia brevispora]|uniref:Uncharacterized protein n=1 Tax=Phlebia brevispora TaxID=194682 RepID=A0ACC1T9G9_9APHY|nr:hypothetical protein NM688_g2097 [Phlebia brevispora]
MPSDQELGARTASPTAGTTILDSMSTSHARSTQELSRSPSGATSQILSRSPSGASGTSPPTEEIRSPTSHVYVVHHDAGRPPVTVYTADGTEVVELPPRYNESAPSGPPEPAPATTSRTQEENRPRRDTAPKPPPVRRVVNE